MQAIFGEVRQKAFKMISLACNRRSRYTGFIMQKIFLDRTKRSRPILPLQGANLSTETLPLYLGFSWGLLPYDKKNNGEVLFYTNS